MPVSPSRGDVRLEVAEESAATPLLHGRGSQGGLSEPSTPRSPRPHSGSWSARGAWPQLQAPRQSSLTYGFSPRAEGNWQDFQAKKLAVNQRSGLSHLLSAGQEQQLHHVESGNSIPQATSAGTDEFPLPLPSALPPPDALAEGQAGPAGTAGPAGPVQHIHELPASKWEATRTALVCGVINTSVTIPVMAAFAGTIFQSPFFKPVIGKLIKLVFLSSCVHQATFTIKSTLPFAVGQVQDVGLIFLSAMANSVVAMGSTQGLPFEEVLGTVLLTLAVSTFTVGVLIIITGYLRLASLVQYIPLPVIGGYLGYVGYFCFSAGVSLAVGEQMGSLASWLQLADRGTALKLAPAVASMLVLMLVTTSRRIRSPWALPVTLVFIPAAFFVVLLAMGRSLGEAREGGWVATPQEGEGGAQFWQVWAMFNIREFPPRGIHWAAMPRQLPTMLALFFVVAFGSSMDVAAIQQESAKQLDYNRELVTVGWSNVMSGLVGAGATGSYIFSQTLFSLRARVTSRLNGAIIATSALLMFLLPFSVIDYLPKFFFGSLIMWIGFDIAKDWLVKSFWRVPRVEYALLWATFVAIIALGLELGILLGIIMASVLFAVLYAQVNVMAFTVVPSRSGAVRTFEQRTVLELFASRCVAVSLSGYIFFGSALSVSEKVLEVAKSCLAEADVPSKTALDGNVTAKRRGGLPPLPRRSGNMADPFEGSVKDRADAAVAAAPRFLLLDFRRVNGLDATAARTFSTLHSSLQQLGVELILTSLPPSRSRLRWLLLAHGVILEDSDWTDESGEEGAPAHCRSFPNMDSGLQFCEEKFLEVAVHFSLCRTMASSVTLAEALRSHLELPRVLLPGRIDYDNDAVLLMDYLTTRRLGRGDLLFKTGDASDEMFIVQSGSILCHINFLRMSARGQPIVLPDQVSGHATARLFRYGPGGIVGELDFFLQRPRSFRAECAQLTTLMCLSRSGFERMAAEVPHLLNLLQAIILRSTCLSASHALEALERSSLEA
ncbi:hypothetical protein WJX72_009880 [[Myrmecia] bisecta]|uniref:Sulfate transporter n=1 Tax=[Myrmecia] bisecta TaxID=41462 RepID=A0AAW1QT28_9CHLO